MSNNQNIQCLRRARRVKSEGAQPYGSMENRRSGFKNRFNYRSRISGSLTIDRLKEMGEVVHYISINEFRKTLLEKQKVGNFLETNEVNQIENELALLSMQPEAEGYLKEQKLQTDDIINKRCVVCNNVVEENKICGKCSTLFVFDV